MRIVCLIDSIPQYIVKLFEEQARIVKFTAQLPSSIVLNYELNDVFIVNDKSII